jgi:predicted membrane-bound spermidine synthase
MPPDVFPFHDIVGAPEVLDRRDGPYGEAVLRRRGEHYEIIANGCFLMDTSDGRSERALITAALDALDVLDAATAADPADSADPATVAGPTRRPHLLVGGLGVGFSLAQAAADPRPGRITVLEREQAVIDWHTLPDAPLARFAAPGHDDPRVRIVHDDLLEHLRAAAGRSEQYDALCLDVDNGPDWTVTESNGGLYGDEGLALLRRTLAPGGVLAVWSAAPSPEFDRRLRTHFAEVRSLELEVLMERGAPDVVHLAAGAR